VVERVDEHPQRGDLGPFALAVLQLGDLVAGYADRLGRVGAVGSALAEVDAGGGEDAAQLGLLHLVADIHVLLGGDLPQDQRLGQVGQLDPFQHGAAPGGDQLVGVDEHADRRAGDRRLVAGPRRYLVAHASIVQRETG
jgi:hypothetical protein